MDLREHLVNPKSKKSKKKEKKIGIGVEGEASQLLSVL